MQAQAAETLLDQDVDVLTQHQDCTKTIIETAEAAGAMTVGYHYDASELAPEGWITGSEWDWGAALHRHRRDGASPATSSQPDYNGDYRVGLQTGDNPFVQSAFGPTVDDDTKAADRRRPSSAFIDGGSPFDGPGRRPGRRRGLTPRASSPPTPRSRPWTSSS